MRLRSEPFILALLVGAVVMLAMPQGLWAAEGVEGRSELVLNLGKLINLLLVVTVLVWVARKPLASFFASRTQAIRDQLAEAQKARQDAEARLAHIEASMSSLDDELRQIRENAEQEAHEEYQRLVAAADKDSEKIVARARQEIEGMTRAAQVELKEQAAELSVALAKTRIQSEMTDEDRARLFARFVSKVGGEQ
jgi:F-type H+-transporting ATPase subunit b